MSVAGEGGMSMMAVRVKEESEWDSADECGASEAAAALYGGHEVKHELVLGPERLQPQDIAYTVRQQSNKPTSCIVKQEPVPAPGSSEDTPRTSNSGEEQLARRTCTFRVQLVHVDNKLHECVMCHKIFLQKSSLMTHLCSHREQDNQTKSIKHGKSQTVPDNKSHACDYCGKWFAGRNSLVGHIKIHTMHKPYSCEICRKQFSYRSTLATHKLCHTGEKQFTCDVCKKTFTLNSHLNRHMRTHTGEKPFTCPICKKTFSQSTHVARHKLVHMKE